MATRILLRRDTSANWSAANPVLALGEPGYDETADMFKIGDGVTVWTALGYVPGGGGGGGGAVSSVVGQVGVVTGAQIAADAALRAAFDAAGAASTAQTAAVTAAATDATTKANAAQAAATTAAASDATTKANNAQAFAVQRANHTGTQSADTLTDGTTNKAFLATERTKLSGVATGATAVTVAAAGTAGAALSATDGTTTNARTPTAHASTHASGGSDPVSISSTQVTGLGSAATQPTSAFDATGAASAAQAFSVQRANHTGTQAVGTITGLATVATSGAYTDLSGRPTAAAAIVVASGDTTGAADTAAINAALTTARVAGGGVVKLVGAQTYYINDRLVVGSYCTLDATGATVIQVDNTNKRITTNYSWMNPVGTASDAAITAAGSIITSPTLAPLAAVGMSITVAGAAGPSGAPVTFCGFVSAVNTGTNQITVTNLDGTTLTAGNTVSAATAVLYNRDIKPKVIGGFWNRGALNHSGGASDQSVHSFHHCDYPYVHPEGVYSQLGSDSGHCIDFADVTRCFGQIDHCDYQGVAVQLTGPVYGATIPRIVGKTFDDAFAITASDWASNGIDTSGNVVGVWVGHIDVTSGVRLVNIVAGLGNLVDEVIVEEVHGTGGNAIGAICIGDDVGSTATVGGTYGSIEIRKIAARPKASSRCVNLISPSFKKITLGLDYSPWTYSTLKTFVEMTGASSVFPQQLEITGYAELSAGQTVVNVFSENSTSVQLDHLDIHDMVFDCNSSTGNLVALQTSNRVNNVDLHRVRMNSGSAGFACALVSIGNSATLGNLRIIGGLAWLVQKTISDTSTVASNITIGGGFLAQGPSFVYWGNPASAAATKTITLAGCVLNSVGTAAFFTTNVPLTFYGDQMVTTGAFTMLSRGGTEVVNAYGNGLPFDLAMLARTVGEFCTDASNRAVTGAIPAVCTTTAASGWKTVAGGTY